MGPRAVLDAVVKMLKYYRFAALENFGGCGDYDDVNISGAWESIRENRRASATKSLGYYELKMHKL
jgi:hypothetical protein